MVCMGVLGDLATFWRSSLCWIEYLYFEYWWLDQFTRTIERLQPDYDKEWQKLVDSGVLRPRETTEYLRSIESPMRRQAEIDQALAAVQRSQKHAERVYAETQLDPRRLNIPKPERIRRMQVGTHELLKARNQLKRLEERSDLIREFVLSTADLERAKRDADRHCILLPWILEQIPSIDAELRQTEEAGLERTKTTKRIKRRLDSDNDSPRQSDFKKRKLGPRSDNDKAVLTNEIQQKRDAGEPGPTPGRKDGPGYQRAKPKRSRDDAADNGPPSKRFRRGGDDLGSHSETSDSADAGSAGDSQESGTAEVGRPDGERAVRTTERPHSKGSKPSSDHLQQRKSTGNAPQSSTTTQPLRRSARITARQEALQNVVTRCGAAKTLPQSSRQKIAETPAPPLPIALQDQQSRFPATKVTKQGARGGSWRDTLKVKATS